MEGDDVSGYTVHSETHYYPFGMDMDGVWNIGSSGYSDYKYNGKELNEYFELDWYDYGARWYDPAIARWVQVDPMAEKYLSYNPYNYVVNNPLIFIDPDGRSIINGAEIRRQAAEEEFNKYESIVNSAESRYGTKKGDFKSKAQFKNYRRAKKLLRNAKRDLNTWTRESANTQAMIDDFKSNSPRMFYAMDNLTNEYGEEVDLHFVSTNNVAGANDGANVFGFDINKGSEVRPQSTFGLNSIEVQLINNPSAGRTNLEVTKHEMGHSQVIGSQTAEYRDWLIKNNRLRSGYDGHGKGDPSGINANKFQNMSDLRTLPPTRKLPRVKFNVIY